MDVKQRKNDSEYPRIVDNNIGVSVIIPTYNRGNVIYQSINSVLWQTYREIEVIIVDDGSTDNTEDVVRNIIKDNRIKYIKLEINKGQSAARNIGVKESVGKYIAFQDSDDIWEEKKLERQIKKIKHSAYSMVYCAYDYVTHGDNIVKVPEIKDLGKLEGNIYESLCESNKIGTPMILVERQSFIDLGGFDESLRSLEDWDFVLRYSQRYKIGFLDEVLVHVGARNKGVNALGKKMLEAYYKIILKNRDIMSARNVSKLVDLMIQTDDQLNELWLGNMIVPELISTNEDYKLFVYQAKRKLKMISICDAIKEVYKQRFINDILKTFNREERVIIRGAGIVGQTVLMRLLLQEINVAFFIDKEEGCILGIDVISVEKAKDQLADEDLIIQTVYPKSRDEKEGIWWYRIIDIYDYLE